MPVSIGQGRDILRRQSGNEAPEVLARRLAPVSDVERSIPRSVPKPLAWTAAARDERIAFLEAQGLALPHLSGRAPEVDPAALQGNIEQFIGMTQIPTGLIGPLRVNGLRATAISTFPSRPQKARWWRAITGEPGWPRAPAVSPA